MNVYILQHKPTGRCYVGKSNNVKLRIRQHEKKALSGKGYHLHAAIRKYGMSQFSLVASLPYSTEDMAYAAESVWIRLLKSDVPGVGFNLDSGGLGGRVISPITRARMSSANSGRIRSPETCKKLSAALTGHAVSAETRAKISAANKAKGHPCSPETKALLSVIMRSRGPYSPEVLANMSAGQRRRHSKEG